MTECLYIRKESFGEQIPNFICLKKSENRMCIGTLFISFISMVLLTILFIYVCVMCGYRVAELCTERVKFITQDSRACVLLHWLNQVKLFFSKFGKIFIAIRTNYNYVRADVLS